MSGISMCLTAGAAGTLRVKRAWKEVRQLFVEVVLVVLMAGAPLVASTG
jgi:hypothetical protein